MILAYGARVVFCASFVASAWAASLPVITAVSNTPATPGATDSVWVSCAVTSTVGLSQVMLTYRIGSGGADQTNTVFQETMAAASVKPWTGGGCDHPWAIAYAGAKSPFEQSGNANEGSGNTNGCQFKGDASTTNLADNTVTCLTPIDARGSAGFVEFWLQTVTASGGAGWAFHPGALLPPRGGCRHPSVH